ncbi:MAG: Tex family protein [Sandaracinaceae bacterium]
MTARFDPVVPLLAAELGLAPHAVAAVVDLLDEGATVPFIARYRKERTGGLDEVAIRAIEERRAYLRELDERRRAILASIEEQGKLTPELRKRIEAAATKAELEDLYLPYKKKRRTRGMMARERGLLPLAEKILAQGGGDPRAEAGRFVNPDLDVPDVDAALAGARDIVAEDLSEDAAIRGVVRETFAKHGLLVTRAARGKAKERSKFEQYYDFSEPVGHIPSHRFLAIRRGEAEGFLKAKIDVDEARLCARIERMARLDPRSRWAAPLREAIADSLARLLGPSAENDVRGDLGQASDEEAVGVFADNLRELLLAAPLGTASVIGIDPGLRTGCKCAALDATGRFLENVTIYPSRGTAEEARAAKDLVALVRKHHPKAIAVGNGTGGRETEAFVKRALREAKLDAVIVVSVSESGASVYSASDVAREEFPELDLTVRGAISIGRRLQDPLAELVKVDPKSIGVGQYQHDVHQPLLVRKLGEVVESCVNRVGVELNTASAPLLSHVAGVGASLAKKIVAHRDRNGRFERREALLEVKGLGPKAYEQCAGFLRVRDGAHPLDASAVHPERYALVERMAKDLGVRVEALVGHPELAAKLELSRYASDEVGLPTLRDIVEELGRPGRDPRKRFEPPRFREDVHTLEDLLVGMSLEGVVTNVTSFGAFVDVGVHQDGLVHVSQLADRFVRDPREVAKVGDRLTVRVLEVDLARKRISLSARSPGGGRRG